MQTSATLPVALTASIDTNIYMCIVVVFVNDIILYTCIIKMGGHNSDPYPAC